MPTETAFKIYMIIISVLYSYPLLDLCRRGVQNFPAQSIEFILVAIVPFRKWFHLDSKDAAVLLTFLIAEIKQKWNHLEFSNYVHSLPISAE